MFPMIFFIMSLFSTNAFNFLNRANDINLNNIKICTNCKWFLPNDNTRRDDYGFCKMHQYNTQDRNGKPMILYEYAKHCRENESLCGTEGFLFENYYDDIILEKIRVLSDNNNHDHLKQLIEKYDDLDGRFSAEIMEKHEIIETEEEMDYLLEQIIGFFL